MTKKIILLFIAPVAIALASIGKITFDTAFIVIGIGGLIAYGNDR